jgi:predicted aspartyl protease
VLASVLLSTVGWAASQKTAPGQKASAPAPRPASQSAQFEALPLMRSSQNQLLVRAYINGKQAWLGVDSGAPVSAIAVRRREHFRLTAITASSNLPARVQVNEGFSSVAIVKSFRLGNLNLLDQPVVTLDLGSTSQSTRIGDNGPRMDGILGADVLFPLQAVLDCQAQLLILKVNPGAAGRPPGVDYRGFSAIPIQVSDGFNLYVNATINGTPARLMLDTGAFATLLHSPFVRHLHIPTQQTRIVSAAVNLKEKGVHVARIRRLSIGSVEMVGKQVGVTDLEGLIRTNLLEGDPPVAGLLGAELLSRNHAIIDFGTKTLYLKR